VIRRIQSDEGMGTGKHTNASSNICCSWRFTSSYDCVTSGLEKYARLDKGAAYTVLVAIYGWLHVVSQLNWRGHRSQHTGTW